MDKSEGLKFAIENALELSRGESIHACNNDLRALVLPAGKEIRSLKPLFDSWREFPERRKGTTTVLDYESFVAFVCRHKDDGSLIFVDSVNNVVTAIFDASIHPSEASALGVDVDGARWEGHRCVFKLKLSDEFSALRLCVGVTQRALADKVEALIHCLRPVIDDDLATPGIELLTRLRWGTPADLVGMSEKFEIGVAETLGSSSVPETGESALRYEAKNTKKFPNVFVLEMPILDGCQSYRVIVKFVYERPDDGKQVLFSLLPWAATALAKRVNDDLIRRIEADTALPVFYGSANK